MMSKIFPIILVLVLMGCDSLSIEEKQSTQLSTTNKHDQKIQETSTSLAEKTALTLDKNSKMNVDQAISNNANSLKQQIQDPASIVKDLKELLEKDKNKGISAIEGVLHDPQPEVRRETLALVYDEALPVSKDMLYELALNDPNDRVRGTAALSIVDYGKANEVKEYLSQAVHDPNPVISRQAQLRLNKLDLQNKLR